MKRSHTDEWPNLSELSNSDGKLPRIHLNPAAVYVVWLFIIWIGGALLRTCAEAFS